MEIIVKISQNQIKAIRKEDPNQWCKYRKIEFSGLIVKI